MSQKDERSGAGFWAFWSSLPGILTGVAAVLAAVGTLSALFVGGAGTESPAPRTDSAAAPASGDGSCFAQYFKGIPRDRLGTVEAGATAYDVISENQPKAGTIGMRFTNNARPIGAIRFAFFSENGVFKIESIVDARCRPIEDYVNTTRGGDKHALQSADTLRLQLAGGSYDLSADGGSFIRIRFVSVVP